jgi:hypothetical protein
MGWRFIVLCGDLCMVVAIAVRRPSTRLAYASLLRMKSSIFQENILSLGNIYELHAEQPPIGGVSKRV